MSSKLPAAHADPTPPHGPRPRMGAAMKLLVAMGMFGGLMGVLAFGGVLAFLATRVDLDVGRSPAPPARAEPGPRDFAPARPPEPIELVKEWGQAPGRTHDSRGKPVTARSQSPFFHKPIVLAPPAGRASAPPEAVAALLNPEERAAAARDRTRVAVELRFVDLDREAAERLLSDASARRATGAAAESLVRAGPNSAGAVLDPAQSAALGEALAELAGRGAARVIATSRIDTLHRRPAKAVVGAESNCTVTFDCLPEVRDGGRVFLDVFADLRVRTGAFDAGGKELEGTTALSTSVQLADGQTIVLGGSASRRLPGGKSSETLVLLTANLHAPDADGDLLPLSETELRDRRAAQCRYLEDQLGRQFPESQVKLSLAAGKLFVHGRAKDGMEMERIVAAARRRAVDDWAMLDPQPPPFGRGPGQAGADSLVVNMLRTPPQPQVMVHLKVVEIKAVPAAPEHLRDEGPLPAGSGELLRTMAGLARTGHCAVLDGRPDEGIEQLARHNLARVLNEPTLVTVSGRKGTVAVGDRVSLPGPGRADYPVGAVFSVLPEVLDQDRVRVEVTPEFHKLVELDDRASQPRLVVQSQSLTAAAVLQSGQTLVVPGVPGEGQAAVPPRAGAPAQRFLLVTPEIVHGTGPVDVAGGSRAPDSAAAPWSPPIAAPPTPVPTPPNEGPGATAPGAPGSPAATDRALAAFFRKAQHADHEESAVGPPPSSATEPLPPTDAETLTLEQVVRAGGLLLEVGATRTIVAGDDVLRATAVEPAVCELGRASRREVTVAGKTEGSTHATVWFLDSGRRPASFAVRVVKDFRADDLKRERIEALQGVLAALFPRSGARLHLDGDRLTVEGQAAGPAEAAQIMAVVRAEAAPQGSRPMLEVVDRLRTSAPGPQQVVLRVKFLAVEPAVLRRAAEGVQRDWPGLVPLAGVLLDLAERGGHSALDAAEGGDVAESIRQMERLGLLRTVAQPTLGAAAGKPAAYLLPRAEPAHAGSPGNRAPESGPLYTTYHFLSTVQDRERLRLEIASETGDPREPGAGGETGRVVAELAPGQTLAAADQGRGRPGEERLIVLVTPEPRAALAQTAPPAGPPERRPSSPPGFTVAESPEVPGPDAPSVRVPESPGAGTSRRVLVPRVLRPPEAR